MDCCDSKNGNRKKADCCDDSKKENMKEENARTKKTFMWVVIGILVIATIFITIRAASIGATGTGQVTSGSGAIDTSGWTENEIMNYQMHGIVPARAGGSSASTRSASSQVGSC